MHYDVIVIGGWANGCNGAAEEGASVLLLDKGNKLGRKLAISGGGRCNVTNRYHLMKSLNIYQEMADSYTVLFLFSIMKILLHSSKIFGVN